MVAAKGTTGTKTVHLTGGKARQLGDIVLNTEDLAFARACLDQLAQDHDPADVEKIADQALWRSAIVHWAKCFGVSKSRIRLDAKVVYSGETPGVWKCFKYFKDLRDKHIVHDENSYTQVFTRAVINEAGQPDKVDKILSSTYRAESLNAKDIGNLSMLVRKGLDWLLTEYNRVHDLLLEELLQRDHTELLALDEAIYTPPTLEETGRPRRTNS